MEKLQIIDSIYKSFTASWVKEDFEGYKWFKQFNPSLNGLYADIVTKHLEFAEVNNEGVFDPTIFEAVLQKIVN